MEEKEREEKGRRKRREEKSIQPRVWLTRFKKGSGGERTVEVQVASL